MRTTLNIDDELYTRVKVEAARRGETVTSLIEDALRKALFTETVGSVRDFPVSQRSGGLRPGVALDDPAVMYSVLLEESDRSVARGNAVDG